MVTLHEVITFLVSMQISISSLQTHNVNRCGRSRHLALWVCKLLMLICILTKNVITSCRDRKSCSAGMPRPISYAVFCLKKKKLSHEKIKIMCEFDLFEDMRQNNCSNSVTGNRTIVRTYVRYGE